MPYYEYFCDFLDGVEDTIDKLDMCVEDSISDRISGLNTSKVDEEIVELLKDLMAHRIYMIRVIAQAPLELTDEVKLIFMKLGNVIYNGIQYIQ